MEEKSTPTSRAIAVIIIIITLIALSVIVPAKWLGVEPPKRTQPKLDLTNVSITKEVAIDTDNDGTISWKEIMTDTLKPTASTLEELKKIPVDQKEIDTLNDPNNLTASFAKNLYLTGAYFEKNGITDEASKEQAMTALIQQEKAKIVPNTYSYKDINVAKAESKDSIRTYGNAIASILENIITEKVMLDDISSISNFITSKDAKDLEPILKNKKRMDTIMSKLLTLSVPPSAVIFHLATLNNVAAYRDMITDLAGSEEDPLRATIVIDKYTLTAINAGRATLQLSNYFTIKNIVFSPKEKGYIFTAGYIAK